MSKMKQGCLSDLQLLISLKGTDSSVGKKKPRKASLNSKERWKSLIASDFDVPSVDMQLGADEEKWIRYIQGKICLTVKERDLLIGKLSEKHAFAVEQFDIFNRELIRRARINQSQRVLKRGLSYSLGSSQRALLKLCVDYASPSMDMGELAIGSEIVELPSIVPNVENLLTIADVLEETKQKCPSCVSHDGKPKGVLQSERAAKLLCEYVKERHQVEQEFYQCPSGNGWHLKTIKLDDDASPMVRRDYVTRCPKCGWRTSFSQQMVAMCPHCNSKTRSIGPSWFT